MQARHRRVHRLVWTILAPLLAAALWFSLTHRPPEPVNDSLPRRVETPAP